MRRMWGLLVAGLALAIGMVAPAAAQNRFWLVNDSGRVIETAFVSPSRLDNWGPDILGSGVLQAGQRVWVTPNFGDCVLDVRVTYAGGGEDQRMAVNACTINRIVFGGGGSGAGATISGGPGASISPNRVTSGDPSFHFINGSSAEIRELYVSLSSDSNWGRDRLGSGTLSPGARLPVQLPAGAGCTVDMRVVYMDGQSQERRQVETCSVNGYSWR
jgi:hypothetical protein